MRIMVCFYYYAQGAHVNPPPPLGCIFNLCDPARIKVDSLSKALGFWNGKLFFPTLAAFYADISSLLGLDLHYFSHRANRVRISFDNNIIHAFKTTRPYAAFGFAL